MLFNYGNLEGAGRTAARHAFERAGIETHLRAAHYDDAIQEAIVGFIRCQDKAPSVGYAFTTATRQAMQFIFSFLREDKSHQVGKYEFPDVTELSDGILAVNGGVRLSPEDAMIAKEESSSRDGMLDDAADVILEIMKDSRKQKRGRAVVAAVRDTNILLLSLQGYSNDGIALEMGMSNSEVKDYLSKARTRIKNYLASISDDKEN